LTPAAYLESIGFLADDVTANHGVWLTPEDMQRFAQRKVGVVHCPESNMMLASGVAPVIQMQRVGIDVGLGTDGPAGSNNNLDMIEEMASAARLQKVVRSDPKALTAREVLELATIGGARALGLGDRIGTLETGKQADLILIDLEDPRIQPVYSVESAIVYAASGSSVATTIVNGRILMRDRKLLTVDEDAAIAKAKEYRTKILQSLTK
jgi:5-methylthioadenosine/S-adenosylhomocysteine deaminase